MTAAMRDPPGVCICAKKFNNEQLMYVLDKRDVTILGAFLYDNFEY
jgi:hypothetical protein